MVLIQKYKGFLKMNDNLKEQMLSGILGFAVGDALGVPVEFVSREILKHHPINEMLGNISYNVPMGTWSDDTSLTLATMDSIIINRCINYEDILNKFCQWYINGEYSAIDICFGIGPTTKKSLIKFINKEAPPIECGGTDINDNGNGSLMRMLPIAFYLYSNKYNEEKKTMLINNISSLTHGHEISMLGCRIFCDYVEQLLDGFDKNSALEQLKNKNYNKFYSIETIDNYSRILDGSIANALMEDIKSTPFIVDTLEASIWCTLNSDNYESSVVKAVNLGYDTDTIAALTGSLNAIIYGKNSIPNRWISKLRKKKYIESITKEYYYVLKKIKTNKKTDKSHSKF